MNNLLTREEAENQAIEFAKNNTESDYIVFGYQLTNKHKPMFQSPMPMTGEQVANMRKKYADVFALLNPYKKKDMKEAAQKITYKYTGAIFYGDPETKEILDKPYYMQAYSAQQALLLIKKAISKDKKIPFDSLFLTMHNLERVSKKEEDDYFSNKYKNKCPQCGIDLNDGGTCPVCDDGEENYRDLIEYFIHAE